MTRPTPQSDLQTPERRDPREPITRLLRDLRASRDGLATREAERRLLVHGPNELRRRTRRSWPGELVRQLAHPLALLLWGAAVLAAATQVWVVAIAVVLVIAVNAGFALIQEQEAERAVEALQTYLPQRASVLRDGRRSVIDATRLVPGDVLVVEEGDRISADARLLDGAVEVDLSAITGESLPAFRSAEAHAPELPLLQAPELVFSGTMCTSGEAHALVFATGMRTELGRIAALSERVAVDESPLERQVRRVAWLIAALGVVVGIAFLPLGTLAAGLPLDDAVSFAIGLLIGNVPEGLLPTITLSLAIGVRLLARKGALVKRLSAVETLGSTTVICSDKTGTLTANRMHVTGLWTPPGGDVDTAQGHANIDTPGLRPLLDVASRCTNAELTPGSVADGVGDPTEIALLAAAAGAGLTLGREARERARRAQFHFDPALRLMSTIDATAGGLTVSTKGAPEAVLPRCTRYQGRSGERDLDDEARASIADALDRYTSQGMRVLALASRSLPEGSDPPANRAAAERDLSFLGFASMFDPPREGVAEAVGTCRAAGIRIIVVTGDHGLTAFEIARRTGITGDRARIVTGAELERMSEDDLDRLLRDESELIFARSSPEAKLRIADALRAEGHVVAMTGDGVNDAPALRRSAIGIAMGRSGTEVAKEAATMVLTDDNFATIVAAVEEGRRVFENIRKFVVYIFAHTTPEIVPFLVFALSGGAVPLALTPLLILAIDLGTETVPALALGREPAEPGLMDQPPRGRGERVIRGSMLVRAWVVLGVTSAALVMGGFLYVLVTAGWRPGDSVAAGAPLHHAYEQATAMTFLGIVACQIGTVFAARTEHASLRSVGILTNRLLLWGIGFEVAFAGVLVATGPTQHLFDMAMPGTDALLLLIAFPFAVWGIDEWRRLRKRSARSATLPA